LQAFHRQATPTRCLARLLAGPLSVVLSTNHLLPRKTLPRVSEWRQHAVPSAEVVGYAML